MLRDVQRGPLQEQGLTYEAMLGHFEQCAVSMDRQDIRNAIPKFEALCASRARAQRQRRAARMARDGVATDLIDSLSSEDDSSSKGSQDSADDDPFSSSQDSDSSTSGSDSSREGSSEDESQRQEQRYSSVRKTRIPQHDVASAAIRAAQGLLSTNVSASSDWNDSSEFEDSSHDSGSDASVGSEFKSSKNFSAESVRDALVELRDSMAFPTSSCTLRPRSHLCVLVVPIALSYYDCHIANPTSLLVDLVDAGLSSDMCNQQFGGWEGRDSHPAGKLLVDDVLEAAAQDIDVSTLHQILALSAQVGQRNTVQVHSGSMQSRVVSSFCRDVFKTSPSSRLQKLVPHKQQGRTRSQSFNVEREGRTIASIDSGATYSGRRPSARKRLPIDFVSAHSEVGDSLWTLDMKSFASLHYAQSSSSMIERGQISKVAAKLIPMDEQPIGGLQMQWQGCCSVCEEKVLGRAIVCPKCGHGGHVDHLEALFLSPDASECPSGCGCDCARALTAFRQELNGEIGFEN